MTSYTVVVLYGWSIHGGEIKKIIHNYKLEWNSLKVKVESVEVLAKFKVENDFKLENNARISSGIWENDEHAIKIVKVEGVDDILLIYKGSEGKFYIDLMSKCKAIGCLIQKIVDNNVIFRNRVNVELIARLSNMEAEKKVRAENFLKEVGILKCYSERFVKGWVKEMLK